jgi:uncharacterized protein (TIGR04255 family)
VEQSTNHTRPLEFEEPPLSEVSFSVQFEDDVVDEVIVLSRFGPQIQSWFPKLEKQTPIPRASEQFEVPPPELGTPFQLLTGPPSGRYWFVSDDDTQVVQVQPDRFIFNWRRVVGDEEYPHFDVLYPRFKELLQIFLEVVEKERGITPVPAWCELAYTNAIESEGETPGTHGQLARILNYLEKDPERQTLPPVEDTQIQQRFRITDDSGNPTGRLYISVVPGFRKTDGKPVYMLMLLARGRSEPRELPASLDGFFNRAHILIVMGFKEVTTTAMHERWKEIVG